METGTIPINNKKTFFRKILSNKQLLLLVIPGAIITFIAYYLPMFGLVVAFEDFKYNTGILHSKFIGLTNFKFFFTSQYAARVIYNTISLNLIFIFTTLIFSLLFAVIFSEMRSRRISKLVQTLMFMPYFISWVAIGFFAISIFDETNGVANRLLQSLGAAPVSWYSQPAVWPFILTGANLWKTVGYSSMMYLAAIMNIPSDIYDAAEVDGANKVQQVIFITIPSIMRVVTILLLLSFAQIFRSDFGMFYNITRNVGALYATTDVVDTFVIRSLRELGDMGMASAAGFLQSVVGFVFVLISNTIVKKTEPDNSLF